MRTSSSYLTNDLGILDGDTTPHIMRAVAEKIVRAALALPLRPAVVLVALFRTIALTTRQHFAFQDIARPTARTRAHRIVKIQNARRSTHHSPRPTM